MQTTTSSELVSLVLQEIPLGNLDTFVSALALKGHPVSERQAHRLLGDTLASVKLRSFADIEDGNGLPLRSVVAQAFDQLSKSKRLRLFFGHLETVGPLSFLVLSDRRGALVWSQLSDDTRLSVRNSLQALRGLVGKDIFVVPHGELHRVLQGVQPPEGVEVVDYAHHPLPYTPSTSAPSVPKKTHPHLEQLEAESIRIIREAVAVAQRPGMLFSMGKDSMVMWTLAQKAFWPEPPPFPLAVIDTRWKFLDMYRFREYMAGLPDTNLVVHINPEAIRQDVNPFDFGSARHTEITKTHALKQVLDEHHFDFVFGGARRDEERSRAKERVFSLRNERHGWDPKTQRPELWNLYNTVLPKGNSMRVFPLSNWTELDVWRYIEQENIPVVPLYFSQVRPFVERDGALIMVDDHRFQLEEGETIRFEPIRFRTLGCYPLTGGVRSNATSVADIITELEESRVSERSSRVIDFDPGASMEQKKKEGYF
jgi:sulfate adenylyltransferase subunit 2